MMMATTPSCDPNGPRGIPIYGDSDQEMISSTIETNSTHLTSFLYNLSVLKDKVHQVNSLASIFLSPEQGQAPESTAVAMPTIGTLIQEIILTSSSMMFACQQLALGPPSTVNNNDVELQDHRVDKVAETQAAFPRSGTNHVLYAGQLGITDQWYGDSYNHCNSNGIDSLAVGNSNENCVKELPPKMEINEGSTGLYPNNYDIVELKAADLLAKYTHYCQVCGKGFKRDANLRMHMRAHGNEYKSTAALANPMKNNPRTSEDNSKLARKYSCPQEGCRWNKNHAKFQPLKSMICVKNHYKRSHCPKMYVCKRCNTKHFSVLSDLHTHEKHCGDLKWQCSCGTTFSRKDKLMGHVALFIGHIPMIYSSSRTTNGAQSTLQMDESR